MDPRVREIINRRIEAEFAPRGDILQEEYVAIGNVLAARGLFNSSQRMRDVAAMCIDELNARGEVCWRIVKNSISRSGAEFNNEVGEEIKVLLRDKLPPELPEIRYFLNDAMKDLQNDGFKAQVEGSLDSAYENLFDRLFAEIDLEALNVGEVDPEPDSAILFDVFISHASEDKDELVRPLAKALRDAGLKVWYDEYTLLWGDRLRRSIDKGLTNSKYGIVVLSESFFQKEWPQRELDGLYALEMDGRKRILPIWHNIDDAGVRACSPMLADLVAIQSNIGIEEIVESLLGVLRAT